MTEFKLEAKTRVSDAIKTRREQLIPGIIYGNNFENIKISIPKIDFLKVFGDAGTSNLIDIAVDDKKSLPTLIHEIQHHPVNGSILHVDFFKVNMKEKVHAEIPLDFIGDSPAVVNLDGTLITTKDAVEVECLPGDLVSEIQVDISSLDNFEKNLKVSDIKVPDGIEILDDPEEVIAMVQEPRSEEELEALDQAVEENVEGVEVEHKGEETAEGEGEETAEETKE